jgi:hypothetical protein
MEVNIISFFSVPQEMHSIRFGMMQRLIHKLPKNETELIETDHSRVKGYISWQQE